MTTQPEALRLAEVFETYAVDHQPDGCPAIRQEALNKAAAELRRLHAESEAMRVALTFYANGEHYNTEPNECFDTVSGEGLNWLFGGIDESTTSIENGSVAKHALESTAPQPAQQAACVAGSCPNKSGCDAAQHCCYTAPPQSNN